MDPRAFCTQARVLVVAGKGGVGKTTVAATVAVVAARAGVETLLVDVEGTAALPALFGRSSPLEYHETELAGPGNPGRLTGPALAATIKARSLTPDDALLEYLEDHGMRRISKRLTSTGTLDVIATAIPGIKDLLVLSKVKSIESKRAAGGPGPELIVVDAPAAGHAVTFLASPRGLADAVTVGPIRSQAGEVLQMISDPSRCQVLLVTMPEETPVNEAIDTAFHLEDRAGIKLAPIVVNGVWPPLGLGDARPAAEALDLTLSDAEAATLDRAAEFRRHRQDLQSAQVTRLAEGLPLPQLTLPYLFSADLGGAEIGALADALTAQIDALQAVSP